MRSQSVDADLGERPEGAADAGVVEQDVEAAEGARRPCRSAPRRRPPRRRRCAGTRSRSGSPTSSTSARPLSALRSPTTTRAPGGEEAQHGRPADAAGAAGDDGDPIGEHVLPSRRPYAARAPLRGPDELGPRSGAIRAAATGGRRSRDGPSLPDRRPASRVRPGARSARRDDRAKPICVRPTLRPVEYRPLTADLREAAAAFAARIPERDMAYIDRFLLHDVAVAGWTRATPARRIAAIDGNDVVGIVTVEPQHGWMDHVGDIRVVVQPSVRGLGVGHSLLDLGVELGRVARADQADASRSWPPTPSALGAVRTARVPPRGGPRPGRSATATASFRTSSSWRASRASTG